MNFVNRVFPRAALLSEESSKKRKIITSILITILLFIISQIIISFIQTPFITAYLIENINVEQIMELTSSGDIGSLQEYFEYIMHIATNMPPTISLVSLFSFAVIIAVFIFSRTKIEKASLYSLGFKKEKAAVNYLLGILIGSGMIAIVVLIGILTGSMEFSGNAEITRENLCYIVLFLFGYMIQGMAEEVICRGYMMTSIAQKHNVVLAVLVNSVFFAMLHLLNPGISLLALFNLFLFGFFASILMLKLDNIWIIGAIHSFWNFTQGNVFGISVSGQATQPALLRFIANEKTLFNGGLFGLEGGLCVTIVLTIGIVIVALTPPKDENLNPVSSFF